MSDDPRRRLPGATASFSQYVISVRSCQWRMRLGGCDGCDGRADSEGVLGGEGSTCEILVEAHSGGGS